MTNQLVLKPAWQRKNVPADSPSKYTFKYLPVSPVPSDHSDEAGYALHLRLSPSIDGFVNLNTGKRFGGHNAFHDYISTITDNKNDQICDIWEKYFHVTLGQLYMGEKTHNEDKLQIVEQTLCNVLNTLAKNQPELPITLETNELKTISGQTRAKGRAETNFVVLSIKESEKLKEFWRFSNEVCVKVQREFKNAQVKLVQFDKVHITIRKYSNYIVTDNMKCIIKENPLQLTCSALDLVQGRDNARERFKINGSKKWWYGVTEIEKDDGKPGSDLTLTYVPSSAETLRENISAYIHSSDYAAK
ncbi:unnamed protein product [Didymodactylos carnosus]|uniref:Uncharacterized protein n=1 Tax=Didymodactylos carnosus TaxID=1234261 RepID=A0A814C0M0_9BILA|nr:unnamed protein product [Didymodactylos carnosus]CAF3711198.1 unnamed protein product [Didymodactylos carnosus]